MMERFSSYRPRRAADFLSAAELLLRGVHFGWCAYYLCTVLGENSLVRLYSMSAVAPKANKFCVATKCREWANSGHAVRSIGSDIMRALEQWEYQDRLRRSRPHVRELEVAPNCEPSPAGWTETAPSPRGMRESLPQHHD